MAGTTVRAGSERAWQPLRRFGSAIVDVVYPKRCATCRQRGAWVCGECAPGVQLFEEPLCAGCGVPVALHLCHCSAQAPALAQVRSAGPFAGWLRDSILSFKYHDEWARAEHLGHELAQVVNAMQPVDALAPVPLHRSRLRARGYNQSALLAAVVAEALNLPVVGAIVRTRATAQQILLSGPERAANVAGAFALNPGFDPSGASVVLIDDVVTTGSTLNACAQVLTDNGAAKVRAATLARQI